MSSRLVGHCSRFCRAVGAAPTELGWVSGGPFYKHGAPNGACAVSVAEDACKVQQSSAAFARLAV
jgi:hypothetical protein